MKKFKISEETAQELLTACEAVLEWAKTPGNHGGNPYCKDFVILAENAVRKVKEEEGR